jgi:DNA-binding beta-propeller fold protein YncE
MRRAAIVALSLAAIATPSASADGLPVVGIDVGSTGVTTPQAVSRYVTIPSTGGTLVERIRRNGGQVLAASLFPGTYTIPAVAYDASAGGLSGDLHTLVLIEPRSSFPRATTRLLVLHTPSLRFHTAIRLRGDFSFDAVSPDGSRVYLIQYLSPKDPTRYAVRSYDVAAGRLDPTPIVDPRDPTEKMRGQPLSRASSRDGRWAYTLYDGGGGTPFVHALDTARGTATCIDLDGLALATLWRLRLAVYGNSVNVLDGGRKVLGIDTKTLAVEHAHGRPWWPWGAPAALVMAVFVSALVSPRVRPRRRAATHPALQ